MPLWVKAGFIAGITLALLRFGWQYGDGRGRDFIAHIELLDGRWRLETGDGTVSYTHLDVYKRQAHAGDQGSGAGSDPLLRAVRLDQTVVAVHYPAAGAGAPAIQGRPRQAGRSVRCLLYTSRCV